MASPDILHAWLYKTEQHERVSISAKDLSQLITSHFMELMQCSMDHTVHVNLSLAKHFLQAVAQRTIKLNSSTVLEGCRLAKIYAKTSKPIDSIVRTMWRHLTLKSQNKSPSGYDHLHPVEAQVLKTWQELRAMPDIKQELAAGSGVAQPAGVGVKQEQVVVKTEVATKHEVVVKEEPAMKKEVVPKEEISETTVPDAIVVSTSELEKTALIYFTSGGIEKVPLVPGSGVWMAKLATGELLHTDLPCEEQESVTADNAGASGDGAADAELDGACSPGEVEVLDSSSDGSVSIEEEPAATNTPFPRTPATIMTMSEEYGSPNWAFGALQPAPAADIMLDDDDDDDEAMAAPADGNMIDEGEAMLVEPDLVEQHFPEDVLDMRRRLLQSIEEATLRVPTHRVASKTPRAALRRFKLVYRPGRGPSSASGQRCDHSCSVMT